MCATILYRKVIKGRLYPKAARTGPYAYAQEVVRVNGKVVARYLGIARLPDRKDAVAIGSGEANTSIVIEKESHAEAKNVVERGEENAIDPGEPS